MSRLLKILAVLVLGLALVVTGLPQARAAITWPSTAATPQHWWPFDQSQNYNDYGSGGAGLLNLGAGGSGNSFVSGGLSLNGSGYATVASNADVNNLGATWSILIEMTYSNVHTTQAYCSCGASTGGWGAGIYPGATDISLALRTYNPSGTSNEYDAGKLSTDANGFTGITIAAGTKYQFIISHSGGQTTYYCNGVICKNSPQNQADPLSTAAAFVIGNWSGILNLFAGTIRQVAILPGTAWSQNDVSNIWVAFNGYPATLSGSLTQVSTSLSGSSIVSTLSGALAQITGAFTGNHGIGATISGTLTLFSASLSGSSVTSTLSGALTQVSASLSSAVVDFTGALSGSLVQVSSALSGSSLVSTLSGALAQVTGAFIGEHGVLATVGGMLTQVFATLTGDHGVAGAISGTLAQVSASLNSSSLVAALSSVLSQATASLSGSVVNFVGSLGAGITQVSASLSGSELVATLAGALSQVTAAISGTISQIQAITAALTGTMTQVSAAFNSSSLIGSLSGRLSQVTASLSVSIIDYTVSLTGTLSQATASLTGAHGIGGTLAGVVSKISSALNGSSLATTLNGILSQVDASLSGAHGIGGTLSAWTNQATAILSCGHGVAAALNGTVDQITSALSVGIFRRLLTYLYVLLIEPENRQLTVPMENRTLIVPSAKGSQ
jgi:hypothetical protein